MHLCSRFLLIEWQFEIDSEEVSDWLLLRIPQMLGIPMNQDEKEPWLASPKDIGVIAATM